MTRIGALSSAIARIAHATAAPPAMSSFMRSMPSAGLIEMPPLSNVTPFPTSPNTGVAGADGGSYRKLVEARMDNKPVSCGDAETLSASLSFALLRLKDEGALDLRRASDSPATRTLSVRAGHRLPYSHAEILRPMGAVA
jgi:hypothetical protein